MQSNSCGYTLIELLIAMALAAIVTMGIYKLFKVRQEANAWQQQVVEMQQNIRAAISLMKREIRMAGYDPAANDGGDNDHDTVIDNDAESAHTGIQKAGQNMIQFTFDNDADMTIDTDERITYRFANEYDADGNGIADDGADRLGRQTGAGTPIPVAENIQAIGFAYAFDNNGDGILDTDDGTVNGKIIWAFDADPNDGSEQLTTELDTGSPLTVPVPLSAIRAVRIWILAQTKEPVQGHFDHRTYTVGNRIIPSADRYLHRLARTTVYCRNMQL